MKQVVFFIVLLVALGIGWAFYYYVADHGPGVPLGSGSPTSPSTSEDVDEVPYVVEEFVTDLEVPWSIVFTSDDRMLVTERPGRLRVVENGELVDKPLHTFSEASSTGEEGLMSIALDPDYEDNQFIYASLAYTTERGMLVKIVRFKDEGDSLSGETTIIDGIPAAQYHAGSRIKFGPDGKLYITTGDATDRQIAQDLDSLGGKILRINADGSIPKDNPFEDSSIWSYGHRNPQGLAWDAGGQLFSSEHGPSVFDGPRGGDEVNKIDKGANYGWPLVSHEETLEGTVHALEVFTPAEAPGSLLIYKSDVLPQFTGNFFFGALVGEGLVRMVPNGNDFEIEKLPEVDFGRIRDVTEGPDGYIYFSTSNRDGRGDPAGDDDRIFRIVPTNR